MNLDLKDITAKIAPALDFTKRYVGFIYFLVFAIICGFLVFRINTLTQAEPTDDAVSEKLQTVQRPHLDQNALSRIQQLQDQNVEVKSLFQQARDNPFSE